MMTFWPRGLAPTGHDEGAVVTLSDVGHWWRVGWSFAPWREAFWCGLAHDLVEDGYAPRSWLRWGALDAVTRRTGEPYFAFIDRAALHPVGRAVKLADLCDNLRRNGGPPSRLRDRYLRALDVLTDPTTPHTKET